jgi:hypothetical protein
MFRSFSSVSIDENLSRALKPIPTHPEEEPFKQSKAK